MTIPDLLLLVAAGLGAGIAGSTAGLASLVSYPALLVLGIPAVAANVTNTVALIGSSIGSVSRSRRELVGQSGNIRRGLPVAILGGAAGAALLLLTPSKSFEVIVPYLVALASVLLLAGPRLRKLRSAADHPERSSANGRPSIGVIAGMVLAFVYGGYFGAAAGVMVLALLLLGTELTLARATALRNLLLGLANATAAVGFAIFADVRWAAVLPLGLGCVLGGSLGPSIVRKVPPTVLRVIIALAGFGLAIKLWIG